ncbi:MAG: hypothetical protein FWD71_09095 [Oscillospiraceae bacterium]|nr:hypothetical protein [Oscillospiraceae bacterium]
MKPLIEGDSLFIAYTEATLVVIERSPDKYDVVSKYVGKIKQGERSGMAAYENPPTFYVGEPTYSSQTEWYASAVVHDSYHSKLYHDYLANHGWVPQDIWCGEKAEYACLEYQISFLEEINADEYLINHAKSCRTSRWWEKTVTW